MVSSPRRRAIVFAGAALAWSVGLLVVALVAPYDGSQTFIEVNGHGVLVVLVAPSIISVVAWVALSQRWVHGRRAAGYVAWGCVWLLSALCLLGVLSIGIYIAPASVLLIVAVSPVQLQR